MKNSRLEKSAAALSTVKKQESADGILRVRQQRSPLERWRRMTTGLRGVRLFRITHTVGNMISWEAECTLNGGRVCRRFASELHARAWLSVAAQSHISLSSVEREELHRPCSSSSFATGG